jgi:hypothetical protein
MGTLTRPYTFTAGTFAVAAQVNVDFDTIYNWINGGAGMWADGSVGFSGIPLLPNTDPTNLNHAARKRYVDNGFFGGVPWAGPGTTSPQRFQIQGGGVTTTLNGIGQTVVTLPNPYPTSLYTVSAIVDTSGGTFPGYYAQVFNPTLTSFGVEIWKPGSPAVPAASSAIRFVWWAMGY